MHEYKNSSIFSDSRFPMFIRGNPNYDQLRRFVKSYFESLEVENDGANFFITNAREHSDVDTTTAEFLNRFYEVLCPDLPKNIMADKRLLLKHSRELYQKKGTPEGFKLLFKILYNEEINIKYPSEQVLRASDGVWNKPIFIQVAIQNATFEELKLCNGTEIVCSNNTGVVRNNVVNVKKVNGTENIYEIYLNKNKNIRYFSGDKVIINNTIVGYVSATTQVARVIKKGKGFKIGQLIRLDLKNTDARGSILKISAVDADGGILQLKFIKYGWGYFSGFTLNISPTTAGIEAESPQFDGANLNLSENSGSFSEVGVITKTGKNGVLYDYFANDVGDYLENDYMMGIAGYFQGISVSGSNNTGGGSSVSGSGTSASLREHDYAIITVDLGPVLSYPGFWSSNRGKLSDPLISLQDNSFYQDFSYVIQSSIPKEKYNGVVKKMMHPVGMKGFGDILIETNFDISSTINIGDVTSYSMYLHDMVDIPDQKAYHLKRYDDFDDLSVSDVITKKFVKTTNDSVSTAINSATSYFSGDYMSSIDYTIDLLSEYIVIDTFKATTDSITMLDGLASNRNIILNDSIFASTVGTNDYWVDYAIPDYVMNTYSNGDYAVLNTNKAPSDQLSLTENLISEKTTSLVIDDPIIINESQNISFNKSLADAISLTDTIVSMGTGFAMNFTDTINGTDATSAFNYTTVKSEVLSIADDVIVNTEKGIPLTDSFGFTDSTYFSSNTTINDSASMSDNAPSIVESSSEFINDPITLQDEIQFNISTILSENISLNDQLSFSSNGNFPLFDTINMSDSIYFSSSSTINDSLSMIDDYTKAIALNNFNDYITPENTLQNSYFAGDYAPFDYVTEEISFTK